MSQHLNMQLKANVRENESDQIIVAHERYQMFHVIYFPFKLGPSSFPDYSELFI
jgi:hypothetical protein